jgi:hypothetical protein
MIVAKNILIGEKPPCDKTKKQDLSFEHFKAPCEALNSTHTNSTVIYFEFS